MRPLPVVSRNACGAWARVALLPLLLACLSSTACMSLLRNTKRGYDLAPNGMTRADDGFRRALTVGAFAGAFARTDTPKAGAPDDALLRALYRGITGYYAGEFDASAAAFASADALAERRVTKSLSLAAASVVTSDAVLPYLPTRTERLFLHYYAMHAHARAGRLEDAVVEARRLGQQLEEVSSALAPGERPLHAAMRDAAGAMFEAAGERNDALVSYRNAALLRGVDRRDVDTITLRQLGADSATLIVFVESGFVAHRVDRGLTIGLGSDGDTRGDSVARGPAASADSAAVLLTDPETIANRALRLLEVMPFQGVYTDDGFGRPGRGGEYRVNRPMHIGEHASTFVRVAWPALARASNPVGAMTLLVGGGDAVGTARPLSPGADVTNALAEDFKRDRALMLARSIARAVAKGAVVEALREKHGAWAGTLASLAGSAFERADTRSWHLLPGALTMVRVVVPAGAHALTLQVGTDVEALAVTLPPTVLASGETRVVSTRIWRDGSAFTPPLAATMRTSTNVVVPGDSGGRRMQK